MSPASEAKFAAEDESKPRKKKPKSQAFQDFENTGLIIGFVSHFKFVLFFNLNWFAT